MTIIILLQQAHFHHKIHSNALPFKHVVLGGNLKLLLNLASIKLMGIINIKKILKES